MKKFLKVFNSKTDSFIIELDDDFNINNDSMIMRKVKSVFNIYDLSKQILVYSENSVVGSFSREEFYQD